MPRKLTTEEFVKLANEIHHSKGYGYDKTKYQGGTRPITFGCPIHGDVTLTQAQSHIYTCGDRPPIGCPKCGSEKKRQTLVRRNKERKITKKEFISKAREVHKDRYDYTYFDFDGVSSIGIIICNECFNSFQQRAGSHIYGEHPAGCPICSSSHGESFIHDLLSHIGIDFIREHPVQNSKQLWDFYIPQSQIYIEFQGDQHIKINDFFGGVPGFCATVKRDLIKIKWILDNKKILLYFYNTGDIQEYKHYFTSKYPEFSAELLHETKRMIWDHCEKLYDYLDSLDEAVEGFPYAELDEVYIPVRDYINPDK